MKVQKLVLMALFLGIGTILHAVIPGFFFGMKPDMLLSMMFVCIFLFADKGNIVILGLAAGILSGLTTTIPGGFLPNIIDKLITSAVIFLLFAALRHLLNRTLTAVILAAAGTLISGTIFLSAMTVLGALPAKASFIALFDTVVLPAAALNTIFVLIIFPIVLKITDQSRLASTTPTAKRG
ncbi:tryptophan transporter TrpP [Scopulibacillus darangshiensis]|uniref:Tryptophan transporter TrpP n=1 Tax=Scopulibacillus darangshiensis TaxID=442528 RepID=A0A4R2P598_9BACL|nr:tryptophan transporter [Scopulibacillus darangshiensis]TCP29274.1 tryptophan transporter TrpP [Scopulibacillus darangshiensis]